MAKSSGPLKSDIEAVFNRLRSLATNKTCFDCNAKNPTWSSVTYGVFICIDCSAVHRNLGVHLTFVRSTNLDTNWTWIQLRQMQLGGNAKAGQFFRQHNCTTTDAQQKYNSRAAQLYRDKLNAEAQQAMRVHGTTLYLDGTDHEITNKKDEEEDFFAECSNEINDSPSNNNHVNSNEPKILPKKEQTPAFNDLVEDTRAPNVDFLNSTVPVEPIKSTIGVRKIQPKKGLAGAKRGGMGATRVKTNFAELEQKANLSDQQKDSIARGNVPEKKLSEEDEATTIASVRLAYQDLSIKAKKEEEKLKTLDPVKAKQMERLGMGFNRRGDVSHSALTDMTTISQEPTPKYNVSKIFDKEPKDDFFDDYNNAMYTTTSTSSSSTKNDLDLAAMGFETIEPIEPIESRHSNISSMFSTPTPSTTSNSSTNSRNNDSSSSRVLKTKGGITYHAQDNDEAQKKFGGAKAISSDQFFCNEASSFERSANLAKFQGSTSISSADYFNDGSGKTAANRGFSDMHYSGPDLDEVKESVRQGVTKVAGRLSSLASGVMTSIQDKYSG